MDAVTYRLTAADLVDARAYVHETLPMVKVAKVIPPAIILGGLIYAGYFASLRDWPAMIWPAGWSVVGILLVIWSFNANRWLLPPSARKQIARDKGLQGDISVSWDDERISMAAANGQSNWPWGDFYKWQASPGGVLLWRSDRVYVYLPGRALTEDQSLDLRRHLVGALGEAGKRRKGP